MDPFQKLIMYSVVLPTLPTVLQKRVVKIMIKECDLGLSKEEVIELEKMYTPNEKWYLNGPIAVIMKILIEKIENNDKKTALKIIDDFILSLDQHQFSITTGHKEQVAEIKHYTDKLQE